jgi:DNA-directed RNA polymerase specialized sigma24 family protein
MKHGDTTAAFDPLHALLERSGARLCALAFMITGDWDLGIDAVAGSLDAGLKNDALSDAPQLCTARRLVAAEAVAKIRPQLRESAARVAAMTADPEEWLGPAPEMSPQRPPTRADVEQALLAIDAFPRAVLLLTIFEGFSIADAGGLLKANDRLVRHAQMVALLALTRHLSCQTRKRSLWVCRN